MSDPITNQNNSHARYLKVGFGSKHYYKKKLLRGVSKWGSKVGGLVARLGYSRQGSRASNRLG
jgi:hypothetical protein